MDSPAPPCAMVIFGAAGDLTKRLLVPALYELARTQGLSPHFRLVGAATAGRTSEQWRSEVEAMLVQVLSARQGGANGAVDAAAWAWLRERMSYVQCDLNDPEAYRRLG